MRLPIIDIAAIYGGAALLYPCTTATGTSGKEHEYYLPAHGRGEEDAPPARRLHSRQQRSCYVRCPQSINADHSLNVRHIHLVKLCRYGKPCAVCQNLAKKKTREEGGKRLHSGGEEN